VAGIAVMLSQFISLGSKALEELIGRKNIAYLIVGNDNDRDGFQDTRGIGDRGHFGGTEDADNCLT